MQNKYIDTLYPGVSISIMNSMIAASSDLKIRDSKVKLKLCFLGCMKRKIKGFDILAESILMLPKDKQLQVQPVCIGDPPKNSLKYMSCKSITFLGFEKTSWKYFKLFDYLVRPSRLEGLGRAGVEAMVFDLPVVTSGVGGIKEYISNDVNGFLVPLNTSKSYKELWLKLFS